MDNEIHFEISQLPSSTDVTGHNDIDARMSAIQAQQAYFLKTSTLKPQQAKSLSKIRAFYGRSATDLAGLSNAARSRHRAVRHLLDTILFDLDLGPNMFFLCIMALSISKLADIKDIGTFISNLKTWYKTVEVTASLSSLALELFAELPIAATQREDPAQSEVVKKQSKRLQPFDSTPAKRHCGESVNIQRNERSQNQFESGNPGGALSADEEDDDDDDDATDASDVLIQSLERRLVQSTHPEVGLGSNAYKLKPIDPIRVLLDDQNVEIWLTMPHVSTANPFITIMCPQKMALQFLTKREQVM